MEFLSIFNSIGTPALILLVLVILFFMIKEIKADNQRMSIKFDDSQNSVNAKIAAFRDEMRADLAEQRKQQEKRDAKQDEVTEQLACRLMDVERNYAKKIDVQEAVGGWRTELKTLGDRIDYYFIGGVKNGRTQ
jgi:uncharacterized membrane protein YhiD involved in acid resistance